MKKLALLLFGVLLAGSAFAQPANTKAYTILGPVTLDSSWVTSASFPVLGAKQVVLHVFSQKAVGTKTQADSVEADSLVYSINDTTYVGKPSGVSVVAGPGAGTATAMALTAASLTVAGGGQVSVVTGFNQGSTPSDIPGVVGARSMKVKLKGFASYYSLATGVSTIRKIPGVTIRAYVFY